MFLIKCSDISRKEIVSRHGKTMYRFFRHVISSIINQRLEYASIPYTYINKVFVKPKDCSKFRHAAFESGLFDFIDYTAPNGKAGICTKFKLSEEGKRLFEQRDPEIHSSPKKSYKKVCKNYDESRNKYPELVRISMKIIKPCPINMDALLEYSKCGLENGDLRHIQNMQDAMVDGKVSFSYAPCGSGRIFEPFGVQSCSRIMREEAFRGIECVNYDLESSQAVLLANEFKLNGIECEWLDNYVSDSEFRKSVMGCIPKDCFKIMFYTTCFGGRVFKNYKDIYRFFKLNNAKLPKYLDGLGSIQMDIYCKTFNRNVKPFLEALNKWHNVLVSPEFMKKHATYNSRGKKHLKKGIYITNACGMKLNIEGLKTSKAKRKIAAHLLQGKESFFIHTLTCLSEKYGFSVYSNQHDGLITDKRIPIECIAECKKICDLECVTLSEKPFKDQIMVPDFKDDVIKSGLKKLSKKIDGYVSLGLKGLKIDFRQVVSPILAESVGESFISLRI